MIFLDTSAVYALASTADPNHTVAVRMFARLLEADETFLTHNYILVESFALLQSRLGLPAAIAFERDSHAFEIEWIDLPTHAAAASRWIARKQAVSFVDEVSFLVMQRRAIETAMAFDRDFERAGFRLARS